MMLSSKVLTLFLASLQLPVVDSLFFDFGGQTDCFFGSCYGGGTECAYDNTCVVPGTLLGNCCGGIACANGLECGTIVDESYSHYYGYNTLEEFDGVCCLPDYGSCYNDEECCANTGGLDGGPTRQCINYECMCPSYIDTTPRTWEAHRTNAIAQGCQLASINSAQEQVYFEQLYTEAGIAGQIWLGGQYVDSSNQRRGWTWIDGSDWNERLAQDNWGNDPSSQPNSSPITQKLAWFANFDWDDGNPTVPLPAIYKCCGGTPAPE